MQWMRQNGSLLIMTSQTAQHELDFLHQRTREGVRKAQDDGKQVGRAEGTHIETQKAKECKPLILKHSKSFGGSLSDEELKKMLGMNRSMADGLIWRSRIIT